MEHTMSSTSSHERKTSSNIEHQSMSYENETPQVPPLRPLQSWYRRYFSDWRFAVMASASGAVAVLVLNVVLYILVATRMGFYDGQGSLYDGDCSSIRGINTAAHLVINILSTILLAASNYTMQILSAPSRREVDEAHAKSIWLDIGIPSTRNLGYISSRKVTLWVCLVLSSVPLHLFYNSSVFSTLPANEYAVVSVGSSFAQNASLPDSLFSSNELKYGYATIVRKLQIEAGAGRLDRLSNDECISAYAQEYQGTRGNVLLVINDHSNPSGTPFLHFDLTDAPQDGSSLGLGSVPDSFGWICGGRDYTNSCQGTKLQLVTNQTSSWSPVDGKVVDYCLSQATPQHCKLQLSQQLILLVIVFNAIKALAMVLVVYFVNEVPLLTLGDAISSFIEDPDRATKGMCLCSKEDFRGMSGHDQWKPKALPWNARSHFWFRAASAKRWIICNSLYTLALGLCIFFLIYGISQMQSPKDIGSLWKLGLGAVNTNTMIRFWNIPSAGAEGLISNSLVVNIVQVVLSFLYFTYNGLFTCMWEAKEWSQYAQTRKSLRVSTAPMGLQRSTYFLQLPCRFALSLMVYSGALHWLVSQFIFLVNIEAYVLPGIFDTLPTDIVAVPNSSFNIMTCGYSPIAILAVIALGTCMVAFSLAMGYRRLPAGSPVASSCSAAISAACQPVDGSWDMQPGASLVLLQWGVVHTAHGVGHCAFSTEEVDVPIEEAMYAGIEP